MTNHGKDLAGVAGAVTSSVGTIVGWQSQLEFWLRILSLVVGIVAGLYTIYHYARKNAARQ